MSITESSSRVKAVLKTEKKISHGNQWFVDDDSDDVAVAAVVVVVVFVVVISVHQSSSQFRVVKQGCH